ncbi:MAG: cyclic-di-AMP receptor [Clostridiales bacterium]|nr:cyclic-di-AMP receptor [Clostridiales bacterium]
MKLIVAIIQDEDAQRLSDALMEAHFGVTKLATTGGFLRSGNTTLISGVEDDLLSNALAIITKICRSRQQVTTVPAAGGGVEGVGFQHFPVQVTVGGATVFVLDVAQFLKV